jgi:hypothetical protein
LVAPFLYEAKVYPLDLMQDVISQLAENPAYKILLLEEKEIEILDALSNSKTMLSTWLGKLQQGCAH